jgi:hypothetical protein
MKVLLETFFSPFNPVKWKWYFGKTAIGVPYFFPRVWKKATPKLAVEYALKEIKKTKQYNERNPNSQRAIKSFEGLYEYGLKLLFSFPKKVGFDFCDLGWKTKWSDTDYRFEYNPVISFVFFGYQIAVQFVADSHYWEAFLYYYYNTKGTRRERVKQLKENFNQTFKKYSKDKMEVIDYYPQHLKKKYHDV